MAISTRSCFEQGGRELIELLTHCVFSFNTDVLFLYLVREYQFRPQAVGAIAIFDVFCGASAPARISATSTIPPRDMRIDHTISQLRAALQMATAPVAVSAPPVTAKQGDPKQGVSEQAAEGTTQPTKPSDGEPIPVALPMVPLPPRFLFDSIAESISRAESSKIAKLERYYDAKLTPLENLPAGQLSAGQRAFVDHVWTPRIRPYLVSAGYWRLATVG